MFPAITIAAEISRAACQDNLRFRPPTAVTICYDRFAGTPLETFDPTQTAPQTISPNHGVALDLLALGKVALPNARSLSPEERSSINEFFLSHFQ